MTAASLLMCSTNPNSRLEVTDSQQSRSGLAIDQKTPCDDVIIETRLQCKGL